MRWGRSSQPAGKRARCVPDASEEVLYGRCLSCAQKASRARREAASAPESVLSSAREQLSRPGRIVLGRREVRTLIELACSSPGFVPIRRPDKRPATRWYARLAGWDVSRVENGLTAPEVAGFWLDFLDVGRAPPVSHENLARLIEVIDAQGPVSPAPGHVCFSAAADGNP